MSKKSNQGIRFSSHEGMDFPDWEEKLLGDVVVFKNGKAHENCVVEDGRFIIVIAVATLLRTFLAVCFACCRRCLCPNLCGDGYNSKFISTEGEIRKYSNHQLEPLNTNDIVMVMSDVPNGKALAKCFYIESDNEFTLNQRICSLTVKEINSKYLYYLINNTPDKI